MANARWTSVAEARQTILAGITPLREAEAVALPDALMRVLAEEVTAPFNVPGHDNSAMDGFACCFQDVSAGEAELPLVGAAFAGHPYAGALQPGTCVKIMTGAQIPAGCDVIVPQEETTTSGERVHIAADSKRRRGQHIRSAGEDLRQGEVALSAGTLCHAAQVGLLASLGLAQARVWRQLRVAFFSTGDEVRQIGEPLGASDVYDSNRHTLRAMIQRMGFAALDFGVVKDSPDALAQTMDEAAAAADVILTSGGASVGEADHIRPVLAARGEVLFWKVAMRPGRPLAYGKVHGADFFGLPGNPVSVMVCFYQFVRQALWKRAGRSGAIEPPLLSAVTSTELKKVTGRMEFQRGWLQPDEQGGYRVTVTGDQGSGILSSMVRGNCFIVLPPEAERVAAGDTVSVQPFESLL